MSFTSTVPAAVARLQTLMQAAAAANPTLNVSVYVGAVIGRDPSENFYCIGDPTGAGQLVQNYQQDSPGYSTESRSEQYSIGWTVRTWQDGDPDPITRLTEASTLVAALMDQVAADADAGGVLLGGSWSVSAVDNPAAGPMDGRGWGVILAGTVDVTDVIIHG